MRLGATRPIRAGMWAGRCVTYDLAVMEPSFDPLGCLLAASQLYGHGIYLGCSLRRARRSSVCPPTRRRPASWTATFGQDRRGRRPEHSCGKRPGDSGLDQGRPPRHDVGAEDPRRPTFLYDPSGSVPRPPG